MDLDAGDFRQRFFKLAPDPRGDMFERRKFESFDLIQEVVVELLPHGHDLALQILEMTNEAGRGGRFPREPDDDTERMPMHPTVGMAFFRIGKKMRRIEKELFVDSHQGIPISLCVWRLSRHLG